jgi:hypothetical protein
MPAATEALAALRDIHLPGAVSFWPPAPGWWAVGAVLVTSSAAIFVVWQVRRLSAKRAALRLVDSAARDFQANEDPQALAAVLSGLLRRVALVRFPRQEVASLYGAGRLGFLTGRGARWDFPADVLAEMEEALYGQAEQTSASHPQAWIVATRAWIRRTR